MIEDGVNVGLSRTETSEDAVNVRLRWVGNVYVWRTDDE